MNTIFSFQDCHSVIPVASPDPEMILDGHGRGDYEFGNPGVGYDGIGHGDGYSTGDGPRMYNSDIHWSSLGDGSGCGMGTYEESGDRDSSIHPVGWGY